MIKEIVETIKGNPIETIAWSTVGLAVIGTAIIMRSVCKIFKYPWGIPINQKRIEELEQRADGKRCLAQVRPIARELNIDVRELAGRALGLYGKCQSQADFGLYAELWREHPLADNIAPDHENLRVTRRGEANPTGNDLISALELYAQVSKRYKEGDWQIVSRDFGTSKINDVLHAEGYFKPRDK